MTNNSSDLKNKYKENFEKSYSILNPEQKDAVDTIEGPVVVVAGPGTGKTQILTLRIANILKQLGGEYAENILALTFTNAGVFAMRKRLSEIIGPETASRVSIFTFHSFCEEEIKKSPDLFPKFAQSKVIDDLEKIKIIEEILTTNKKIKLLKTFGSSFHYTRKIISAIDKLKSEAVGPEEFESSIDGLKDRMIDNAGEDAFYKVNRGNFKKGDVKKTLLDKIEKEEGKQKEISIIYSVYQEKLDETGFYDFSDMILSVVSKAKEDETYLTLLQEKYMYLLVDEHQDTNDSQSKIIELISSAENMEGRPNVFTVGDEKQAIYRFQGASVENFAKFRDLYKDTKVINLKNNYRSGQKILDLAENIISSENSLEAKNPQYNESNTSLKIASFDEYKKETSFIAHDIKEKIASGVKPEDIAIFYKENKNLEQIKSVLDRFEVPYSVFSKENILKDKEILKILMLLKAVQNPLDNENLSKCLYIDFLNLETYDVLKILDKLKKVRKNQFIIKLISDEKVLDELEIVDKEKFINLSKNLSGLKKHFENNEFLESFEYFLREFGCIESILSKKDNRTALNKLEKLFSWTKNNFLMSGKPTLEKFVSHIDILNRYDIAIETTSSLKHDGVALMTAHGSKGLEFEYVYLTNFIDSVWGGKKMRSDFALPVNNRAGDIDDEKRLFYVASTRAKREFLVSYSIVDEGGKQKNESRFLEYLELDFVEHVDTTDFLENIYKNELLLPRSKSFCNILDLDYIREEFLKTPLTVSALNNYYRSPLIYFFRNFLKIPSAQNKILAYGNLVHKVLELYFVECKKESEILSKEKMIEILDDQLTKSQIYNEYFDEIKLRAIECLEGYYNNYKDEFTLELETEQYVKAIPFNLDNGNIVLRGIIDKIEIVDGNNVRVVDYKTGKSWSEKDKAEKESLKRQIIFYKLLLDDYFGGKYNMVEGVLDFVEKNKKGEYERQSFSPTADDISEIKQEITEFCNDIYSGEFLNKEYKKDLKNAEYFDYFELLKNTDS